MAVNFKGIFLCTKAEVTVMLKQKKREHHQHRVGRCDRSRRP